MNTKPYSEMSADELNEECELWWAIIQSPKGPGAATNDAREGAYRLYQEASAWLHRREIGK